jgi:hypothetical protein
MSCEATKRLRGAGTGRRARPATTKPLGVTSTDGDFITVDLDGFRVVSYCPARPTQGLAVLARVPAGWMTRSRMMLGSVAWRLVA